MKKRKFRIILAVILALLVIGVVARPILAALLWEYGGDTRTVIIDMPYNSIRFHSYGYDDWQPFEGTEVHYERWNCGPTHGERVRCFSPDDGSMSCFLGCARITPTVYYP